MDDSLRQEIEAIWGVDLEIAPRAGRPVDLADALTAALDEAGMALLRFLADDPSEPARRVVSDLAEILTLPRLERSEHRGADPKAPPFRIRKLLLEYAVWAHKLDALTGALTKGFCARACDRLPAGCCTVLGYDMGVTPARMLEAQALEARRSGWRPPAREDKCRYHTPRGCALRLFKTPACTGMLCEPLVAMLRGRHPGPQVQGFLDALADFRNRDLDRGPIFESMARVWAAGRALLATSPDGGTIP